MRPEDKRENEQRQKRYICRNGTRPFPIPPQPAARHLKTGFGRQFPDNMLRSLRCPCAGVKRLRKLAMVGGSDHLPRVVFLRDNLIQLFEEKFVVHRVIIT